MTNTAVAENHEPEGKWIFNEDVANSFDKMLIASVPSYVEMRRWVHSLATHHLEYFYKRGGFRGGILELGSSRGESLVPLNAHAIEKQWDVPITAVEVSEPMNKLLREALPDARILDWDITRRHCELVRSSHGYELALCILTLMFIPIERRQDVLNSLYESLRPGSMFILVEKTLGSNGATDGVLVNNYYDFKHANGYTRENIDRKRLSLEGVLVPCKAEWNEDLLRTAGFINIQPFWRALQFAGWFCYKPPA